MTSTEQTHSGPDTAWFRGEGGSIHGFDLPLAPEIAAQIRTGRLVQVDGPDDPEAGATPFDSDAPDLAGVPLVPLGTSKIVPTEGTEILSAREPHDPKRMGAQVAKTTVAGDSPLRFDSDALPGVEKARTDKFREPRNGGGSSSTGSSTSTSGASSTSSTGEAGSSEPDSARRPSHSDASAEADPMHKVAAQEPSSTDPKSAWVDYAVAHGRTRGAADAMTKSELIDEYGRS